MRSKTDSIAWAAAAAFALLSAAVGAGALRPVDASVLRLAQSRISLTLDSVGHYFSVLGEVQYLGTATLLFAAGLAFAGRRALGLRLAAVFVATGLLELAMKFWLPQAVVFEEAVRSWDETPLVEIDYPYPYPSGHMLRATILLGTVFVLWPNRTVRAIAVVLLAGMAATRVYLGVHWFSDVLGGALLGAAGVAWAVRKRKGVT